MARGVAVLVGVNHVNPANHGGIRLELPRCEELVDAMEKTLDRFNYNKIEVFKTERATCSNVSNALRTGVQSLESGDMLVFYYIGHGGTSHDPEGDEEDTIDESLVLYDGYLKDDALADIWVLANRNPEARLFIISDCCYAEGMVRLVRNRARVRRPIRMFKKGDPIVPRDALQGQIIHYAASAENEVAANGAFTCALLDAFHHQASYKENYVELYANTKCYPCVKGRQRYVEHGPVTQKFRESEPFRIQMDDT